MKQDNKPETDKLDDGNEAAQASNASDIQAVDATGAGDNFVAGFTAEILRGSTPYDALRFANACGAICTTAVGAGTALKNRDQVLEFLDPASAERVQ